MSERVGFLLPAPRELRLTGGRLVLQREVSLVWPSELRAGEACARLRRALDARGHSVRFTPAASPEGSVEVGIEPGSGLRGEGYRARIDARNVSLVAGGAAGLFYAVCTLVQLIEDAEGAPGALELPRLEIADHPDFAVRGVMLDVSRDKVPTLATLRALCDRLAGWKINQLSLYMEHTFAYAGHEVVWRDASPFSAEDIRELDAYAAERHVELVPNQNSFGHMQRWLVHEPYRQLAECPAGFVHPWNPTAEPYGLCATDPGSLRLLEDLYDQLLPNFSSRNFNVGLDETLDLGACRSRELCRERGVERVYLDFLHGVHERVRARGRRMQFWGDIIIKRPDLVSELPKDATALVWGYEAEHPFGSELATFRRAGLECYVCPGTSSWNSLAGRTDNAVQNLAAAARAGVCERARGFLTTDWGDHGHLQPLAVSHLGFALGAAFGWNAAEAQRPNDVDVARLLDARVFRDAAGALGRVAYDLGNSYREAGSLRPNSSVLFWLLINPARVFSPPGVTCESLDRTLQWIDTARAPLAEARPRSAEGAQSARELAWVADLLSFCCRLGLLQCATGAVGRLADAPRAVRLAASHELELLIERHRAIWLDRNRPGGLADSARRLEAVRERLLA